MAFTANQLTVIRMYLAFVRAPETSGFNLWVDRLDSGETLNDMMRDVFENPAVQAIYPNSMSDQAFLTVVYENVLGRTADAAGRVYWGEHLANGDERSALLMTIIDAAMTALDGTPGKAYLLNRYEAAQYAISQQLETDIEIAPAQLTAIMATVTADPPTLAPAAQRVDQATGTLMKVIVSDDWIEGAELYLDVNDNGRLDDSDTYAGTSDSKGSASIKNLKEVPFLAVHGKNATSGLENIVVLSGTGHVANPLTTLLYNRYLLHYESTQDEISAKKEALSDIKNLLNFEDNFDFENQDAYTVFRDSESSAEDVALAQKLYAIGAMLYASASTAGQAVASAADDDSVESADGAAAYFRALAMHNQKIDFTSATFIEAMLKASVNELPTDELRTKAIEKFLEDGGATIKNTSEALASGNARIDEIADVSSEMTPEEQFAAINEVQLLVRDLGDAVQAEIEDSGTPVDFDAFDVLIAHAGMHETGGGNTGDEVETPAPAPAPAPAPEPAPDSGSGPIVEPGSGSPQNPVPEDPNLPRTITGNASDQTLTGGPGNDIITGGTGMETIYGNGGNDLIVASEGSDVIDGGDGVDTLQIANDLYDFAPRLISNIEKIAFGVTATPRSITLSPEDVAAIYGPAPFEPDSPDLVISGPGDYLVKLKYNEWNITVSGDNGADTQATYTAKDGTARLSGHPYSFALGFDSNAIAFAVPAQMAGLRFSGTGGIDSFFGSAGGDYLEGGSGNDQLIGLAGDDILDGGDDNDVIDGGLGNNTLMGGAGDDNLKAGAGYNIMNGDAGNDDIVGGTGGDIINGGDGDDIIDGDTGNDAIDGGSDNDDINGGTGNDILRGGTGRNTLFGGDGIDLITPELGRSPFYLSPGFEVDGGTGDDEIIVVSQLVSTMTIDGGDGTDTLVLSLALTQKLDDATVKNIEKIRLELDSPSGTLTINPNVFNNNPNLIIYGRTGNKLELIGEDWSAGLTDGTDYVVIDSPNSGGSLTIAKTIGLLRTGVPGDVNETLTGGVGDEIIHGDGGADEIWGGAGADELWGENGNDQIWGDDGDDWMSGGFDNDTLNGGLGDDYLQGNEGDDSVLGGDGIDTINGGLGDDTLKGDDGVDVLNGQEGNNVIYGGAGNDGMTGNYESDTLYGEGGNDTLQGGFPLPSFIPNRPPTYSATSMLSVEGGEGDDTIIVHREFFAQMAINGGVGFDTYEIEGAYNLLNNLDDLNKTDAGSLTHIEKIRFGNAPGSKLSMTPTAVSRILVDGMAPLTIDGGDGTQTVELIGGDWDTGTPDLDATSGEPTGYTLYTSLTEIEMDVAPSVLIANGIQIRLIVNETD